MPTLKISGLSIVLLGDFNAKIFQPFWFSAQNLITESEANGVSDLLVAKDIAVFKLPWLAVEVNPGRFSVSTLQDSHFEAVRDLAVGTFKLLRHTPVTQLGINFQKHFLFEDEKLWNE